MNRSLVFTVPSINHLTIVRRVAAYSRFSERAFPADSGEATVHYKWAEWENGRNDSRQRKADGNGHSTDGQKKHCDQTDEKKTVQRADDRHCHWQSTKVLEWHRDPKQYES